MRHWLPGLVIAASIASPLHAQTPDAAFFETRIRPVLAKNCYGCHSSAMAAPKGNLVLDAREGLRSTLVSGKPEESRLLEVLSFTDPVVQMPPKGKLADSILADFRQWIAAGAIDPRGAAPATAVASATTQYKGLSLDEGRKWWAFQPVAIKPAPNVATADGPRNNKVDSFILTKLADRKLAPSPKADKRTLVTRAYVDLVGYKPTFGEVQAFLADQKLDAYARLVDRLMASPQYGERWGRRWMDVVRYAEDNPTSEATNPPYPFAWRYRDWIVEAINADMPYDRFVKLQLAADLMPNTKRSDMRALGYLGAAPVYHHDLRLSGDVIGGFMTDDWDERIDAVSRGLLGVSISCARCHDHKFDPFSQKDYTALMGVFASTTRAERPMFAVDAKAEQSYMLLQRKLFDLSYSANLLVNETSTFTNPSEKSVKWKSVIDVLKAQANTALAKYPQLVATLERYWTPRARGGAAPPPTPARLTAGAKPAPAAQPAAGRGGRGNASSTDPYMNAVFEAARDVDVSDLTYTFITYKPGETRDMPVFRAGNYASPGAIVPRGFPAVLAKGDTNFRQGSGRRELADRIFTDSKGLAARVIVNRVWAWHFGQGLVTTPSDFGTQGEKASHPELLDDLAARFISNRWSLKWLNREIMLSATYQQASRPRADGMVVDQANALLWRQNPQRLDSEAYRDTLVRAAGVLDLQVGGAPGDLDDSTYFRRAIYGRVSRARSSQMQTLFDFPAPTQTAPNRDVTTSTLQQVFLMNSEFVQNLSAAAVKTATAKVTGQPQQVAALYQQVLARNPNAAETEAALAYLQKGTLVRLAQILLSTNEEIFLP